MDTLLWRPGLQIDPKDPDDILHLEIDWSDKLGGDPISGTVVTSPSGISAAVVSYTDETLVISIGGGTAGGFYVVTFAVDTAAGQHFERSITVPVDEL